MGSGALDSLGRGLLQRAGRLICAGQLLARAACLGRGLVSYLTRRVFRALGQIVYFGLRSGLDVGLRDQLLDGPAEFLAAISIAACSCSGSSGEAGPVVIDVSSP